MLRGDDVGWADLTYEFFSGSGPERSLFIQGHPMVEDLRGSRIERIGRKEFGKLGGEALLNYDVKFAPWNGATMTEQFIGGARVSVMPYGDNQLMFIVNNTTDRNSLYYHLPVENRARDAIINRTKQATTYQRYIWIGPR